MRAHGRRARRFAARFASAVDAATRYRVRMRRRPRQGASDDGAAVLARAFERSLELTAEVYGVVAKLEHATTERERTGRREADLAVLACFEAVRSLYEPNAIRFDRSTCESFDALLGYRAAFARDGGADEPETAEAFRHQLGATKRQLEFKYRQGVGIG